MTVAVLNPVDSLAARIIMRRRATLSEISSGFASAIREGLCKYVVRGVLSELERYSTEGFGYEEFCMAVSAYPDAASHAAEHDRFSEELASLRGRLSCQRPDLPNASYELSVEINRLLADWLREHVGRSDMSLAASLRDEAG